MTFEHAEFSGSCSFGTAVFDGSVYFRDTHFGQDLGFGNAEVTGDLWIEEAAVDADAWFYGARVAGALRFGADSVGGTAMFRSATTGEAHFTGVRFLGAARFDRAVVDGTAYFDGAVFEEGADFGKAAIAGPACFDGAHFQGLASFDGAELGGAVQFPDARFRTGAGFSGARIGGDVSFHGARLEGDVSFKAAVFRGTARVGPVRCTGLVDLSDAVFETAVTLDVAEAELRCRRTRWASTAALRLGAVAVDMSDAVLEFPVTVSGRSGAGARVTSVSGVDAAHLVLADVDLTVCRFVETVHLDQLRLEGRCVLPLPPPVRWTRRRTLAEEHHWRAAQPGAAGWTCAPEGVTVHGPATLAPLYRQLRKALEDGRNEPGAADFYYGEMEMRRHDRESPRGERMILWLYWALSGYGLRALRALAWLGLAMTATVLAMMLWGLPQDDPITVSKGRIDHRTITLTTKKPDPPAPSGPYRRRLSTARLEKSLRVVANSVIFRASGQDLTTTGTYTEMTARLIEPTLLGLAVLAVRSRVKR